MSKIAEYLQQIISARYGKDVRQSIHDSIEELNNIATGAQNSATAAANTATAKANEALAASQIATTKAEESLVAAEQAKTYAESASAVTGVEIATQDKAGLVKGGENHIAEDGTLTLTKKSSESTLYNSHAGGIKLNLGGVSQQKQYSGKNLVNNVVVTQTTNGITFTVNDDKSITIKGTATAYTEMAITDYFTLDDATEYILSGCSAGGGYSTYALKLTHNNAQILTVADLGKGVSFVTDLASHVNYRVYIHVHSGQTIDATFYPMIRKASVTDATYEPYVGGIPAPNPDYPQEINSVVVSEIKTHGKNEIDITFTSRVLNGITFTVNADKSITLNGTVKDGPIGIPLTDFFTLEDDTKYILSGCIANGSITTYNLRLFYKQANYHKAGNYDDSSGVVFETDLANDINYRLYLYAYVGQTFNNATFKPMIRRADIEDDTYEPYTESVVTLSNPITLDGIGESIDILNPSEKRRRFATYVFDGSEEFVRESVVEGTAGGRIAFTGLNTVIKHVANNVKANIKCTHYIADTATATYYRTKAISVNQHGNIYIWDDDYTEGTDEFKALLAEQYANGTPVTLTYELAEEVIEPLPEVDQIALRGLKSFDTVTYISTDSEVEPIIDAEYGTSKVGALALENSILHEVKDILLAQLSEEQDIMSDYLGAIRYIYLSNTLGATSYQKPWLELEAQFSKMQNGVFYNGLVSAGTQYTLIGRKVNENFATFSTFSYERGEVYHIWKINNVWYHEQLALNSNLTDYMVAVEVEFDFTEVDSFNTISKDITSLIPEGYKVIDAHGVRGGGDYVFISDIRLSDNTLSLSLYNPSGNIDSGYPAAKIICVRDI